jgi:ribonuclease HII
MASKTFTDAGALFEFDLDACGHREMAGADEVGRGCLAGPIVAAAVVFDYSRIDVQELAPLLKGLGDSKKLTLRARERLFPLIIRHASRFTIISAGSRTIDECGLHKTNLRVLARSLEALAPCPEPALVDGRQLLPGCLVSHRPIIKGDSKSACIAAASIIAKVTRDRLMLKLHQRYPEYGFASHVGYGSLAHREAIARHGYSPLHRRSFNVTLPISSEMTTSTENE